MRNPRMAAWAVAFLVVSTLVWAPFSAAADDGRVPVTEEEGRRIAEAALRYTEVMPAGADPSEPGMPYLWGGRNTIEDLTAVPAMTGASEPVGVDASGLVVNALREALGPDVRFAASVDGETVRWADATSRTLYQDNVQAVDPRQARAGDLLFFGSDGDVTGVAVVVEKQGERIDFVVASARAGRVIRTFARIGGDYWQSAIVGVGRFLKPAPAS